VRAFTVRVDLNSLLRPRNIVAPESTLSSKSLQTTFRPAAMLSPIADYSFVERMAEDRKWIVGAHDHWNEANARAIADDEAERADLIVVRRRP
jgi:hypothetical protein